MASWPAWQCLKKKKKNPLTEWIWWYICGLLYHWLLIYLSWMRKEEEEKKRQSGSCPSLTCLGVFPEGPHFGNVGYVRLAAARAQQHAVADVDDVTMRGVPDGTVALALLWGHVHVLERNTSTSVIIIADILCFYWVLRRLYTQVNCLWRKTAMLWNNNNVHLSWCPECSHNTC